jgi:hypothetical protein
MPLTRRAFMKGTAALAAVVGPWSIAGRKGHAATADSPALKFLTPSEYTYINKMARVVVPDSPVLDSTVDVAKNLDTFFAEQNTSPDFLIMMRYLRLIRLADPVLPVLNRLVPATGEDIESFKKTICFLGYYSDANGEADLPPEKRVVWPRLGYGGPKPDDWWPAEEEPQIDVTQLEDRVGRVL